MSRLKTLSVLVGTFAMLALSAAPASAIWESNNGQTTGAVRVLQTGEFSFGREFVFKCPNTGEFKAQWQIQGAGQIKEQQKITTKGPHLQLQVKSWGKCEAEIIGGALPIVISECNFQLVQQAGTFTATAGISKHPCIMETMGCVIQIPIGMEKTQNSGTGINVGLKLVELSNVGKNQLGKVSIAEGGEGQRSGAGIFAQSTSSNPICVLSTSEELSLTGFEFEA